MGFPKNLGPISKAKMGRHKHRLTRMSLSQPLKQQLGSSLRTRHSPSFIQHQQVIAGIAFQQTTPYARVLSRHSFIAHPAASDTTRPKSLLTGFDP